MSVAQDHYTNGHLEKNQAEPHHSQSSTTPTANGASGYQGGMEPMRSVTPGGHFFDDNLIIAGSSHRKIANPVPTAAFAFATTTMILSLYNVGAAGVTAPEAVVAYALGYGGFVQWLGGLWEFAAGNTFGATVFCTYGMFWIGLAMLFIPFFNELAPYTSTSPAVYAAGGLGANETGSAVGLFLFVWLGVTLCLTLPTFRASVALVTLLSLLDVTFILLGLHYYLDNAKLQVAGGAVGIVLALNAYYVGLASLFTKQTSFFSLPTGSLAAKD